MNVFYKNCLDKVKKHNAIGIIEPATITYVPDRSKFKSWEDVIDYLIATGIKIEVRDGISVQGVDVETIKKYSK